MGKFCFPSCCFSCSCFSSSSLPQQPANAGPSSQPSQQPANAGPSSPSSSQQPANSGPSSPSSSQQPANAGPSSPPATTTDLKSFLHRFNDVSQLRDLIKFIEDLLKNASGEKCQGKSSSDPEVGSYIQDSQTFLEFVDKHVGKLPEKEDSIDGLSAEAQKILINLLKGAGKIHWVGAAFSVVGFVLTRFNEMFNNKRECLEILKAMVNLGKQIVELNEQMPEQKQKLNEAVGYIVVGCCMCTSQLAASKISRFLTASVNGDSLKAFQLKIDRLYNDLQLWGIIDLEKRLPKTAPQSQKIYSYKPAVGIDSAREEVIRLLDLSAQNTSSHAVVVHGFGGIGKTTLADDVYKNIDLQSYKHCRIHILQHCTKTDLKALQEQILNGLFNLNVKLRDCDEGRGMMWSSFEKNPNQPLFLYIDNGLQREDLKELLPADFGSCLPPKSRLLLTTRNYRETDMFEGWNIQRQQYSVSPLPSAEAKELLLKKVPEYNDEGNIHALLNLCGGVPLLLEIIGARLAISIRSANDIEILEMIREGEKVEEEDISDRMVDFVYGRLSPRVKEAFLDIASFFSRGDDVSKYVAYSVGEEEFGALEEASFVKTDEGGYVIVHDIVRARGKKMSEGNRITDSGTLWECLKDEEKLKNLKGVYFTQASAHEPPIEINEYHLNCMSNSLRILRYEEASQITFRGKCHKPFKQLRHLWLPDDIPDLPMEFEKLEHLAYYDGPLTQGMSLYELPPSLRLMWITKIISSENGVASSKIPSKDTPPSSLVELGFWKISTMERLPDGLEKLTKLKELYIFNCPKLRELPFKIGELGNLETIELHHCRGLEEWPSSFGDLRNLKKLILRGCSSKLKESLPNNIKENCNI